MGESRLHELTTSALHALGEETESFHLLDAEWARIRAAADTVDRLLRSGETAYGIHTHYGHNVKTRVEWEDYPEHQQNLLEYLHVGVGPALPRHVVRRALRLQCLKVAEGRSGVSPALVGAIIDLANGPCDHTVPSLGSLGASGDLIPMAHAIAPAVAAAGAGGPRDVIGMVNTNAMMASLAVENLVSARRIVDGAHEVAASVSLALAAPAEHFAEELFGTSNPRQVNAAASAERLRALRQQLLRQPEATEPGDPPVLQERYSVRCAPMVLGDALDLLEFAEAKILAEALAVADNPVLSRSPDGAVFRHGGLFYAASLATAADLLDDVLQTVCNLMDRQVLLLMDTEWSHGLPDNLALGGGDHLKGIHQLLSALVQKLKSLSARSHQLGFSAEQHNQDVLPAAMNAHLQVSEGLELAREVLRGAVFSSRRAVLLRLGRSVPAELRLPAWQDFRL